MIGAGRDTTERNIAGCGDATCSTNAVSGGSRGDQTGDVDRAGGGSKGKRAGRQRGRDSKFTTGARERDGTRIRDRSRCSYRSRKDGEVAICRDIERAGRLDVAEGQIARTRHRDTLRNYVDVAPLPLSDMQESSYYRAFVEAMNDDFNTRVALAGMYDLVRDLNNAKDQPALAANLAGQLKAFGLILGVLQVDPETFLQAGGADVITGEEVERLIAERIQAKSDKNYARADELRKFLLENKIVLEDSKAGGTQWRRG